MNWKLNNGTGSNQIATFADLSGTSNECITFGDLPYNGYTYITSGDSNKCVRYSNIQLGWELKSSATTKSTSSTRVSAQLSVYMSDTSGYLIKTAIGSTWTWETTAGNNDPNAADSGTLSDIVNVTKLVSASKQAKESGTSLILNVQVTWNGITKSRSSRILLVFDS